MPAARAGESPTPPVDLRHFQFMVDQSSEEAYLVRRDGRFAYVNESAARSLGYSREELLGLSMTDVDPDFGPRFQAHVEDLKAGPPPAFETVHLTRDGRRVVKEIRAALLRVGADEYVCGFAHDVSARRDAERRTQGRLRLERALRDIDRRVIDQADLGDTMELVCRAVIDAGYRQSWVGIKEADGTVRGVAAAGAEPGYLASVRIRWDDTAEGRGPTGTAIRSGEPFVCERIADDPRFAPWRAAALRRGFGSSASYPLLSADREVLGALNAYREQAGPFTDEDLRTLETLAGQCTVAILSARRQQALRDAERQLAAAQRMEAVGTLAGGIAHDFNNLLTGILGFAQVLRERLAGNAEAVSDLDEILAGGERAATLTRQLLTFARRQPIARVPVDLNALVSELLAFLRRVVGEHIEIAVDLAPGLPPVPVDPGQIEQVLLNLCVNARDAMPAGGTLHIETLAVPPAAAGDRQVAVRVSDTGAGIAPEVRHRVFEPFFTTKGPGRGTGLGLAVSYGIVKQHGGSIEFESELGRGTRFEVRLPVADGAPEPVRPRATDPVRGGRETILVADDEPLVRILAERALSALGYRVLLAQDGADAVERVRALADGPDLAVLDVVMPRLRGPDALEEMRRLRPGLKALFVSGYAEPGLEPPPGAGGAPLLPKPFGPAALARKVRDLLDGA